MNLSQYREDVRAFACPACSAAPGDKCVKLHTDHDPREDPPSWTRSSGVQVDYVHDDRSHVHHEAVAGALADQAVPQQ